MKTDRAFAQAAAPGVVASLVGAILCFTATAASAEEPLKLGDSQLEPVNWTELASWRTDDHLAAFAAYRTSCQALRKIPPTDGHGPIHGALWNVCRKATDLQPKDSDTARTFFEQNFQPVRIARLGEGEGFLTGYFEPIVQGSRFPNPEFHIPLYRRPPDLVAPGQRPGSDAFPNKGARIGRRNENNQVVPYHDRGAIEAGVLDGQKLEICWLKDPFDVLAIQIEGSGRVILEAGTPLSINSDSHNGYPFSSIGRVLIERNLIPSEEISMQRIREWISAHPDEAAKVRAANRSYVFFRITGLTNEGEPVGAQGVPLTAGRSIAVDRLHEYGTPFFIEANLPIESAKSASPFRRLMIAQDTGSAIVGPARADLYWGAGDDAGRIAGRIRHPGRFAMLVPRELDLVAAGRHIPLPMPKPKIAEIEVDKTDGKGAPNSAKAGEIVAGKHVPSPAPKPKMPEIEVKKQDRKGTANSAKAGEIVAGKHVPSWAPEPKMPEIEAKKADGKGRANSAKAGKIVAGEPKMPGIEVKKQDGKGRANSATAGKIVAGEPKMPKSEVKKRDGKGGAGSANAG